MTLAAPVHQLVPSAHKVVVQRYISRNWTPSFHISRRFSIAAAGDMGARSVVCSCNPSPSTVFLLPTAEDGRKKKRISPKPSLLFYDGRRPSPNPSASSLSAPATTTTTTKTIYSHLIPSRCCDYARQGFSLFTSWKSSAASRRGLRNFLFILGTRVSGVLLLPLR